VISDVTNLKERLVAQRRSRQVNRDDASRIRAILAIQTRDGRLFAPPSGPSLLGIRL